MYQSKHEHRNSRRRGAVAVQVGITMIVLLGFAALAVDVGFIFDLHGSMQSAVDSSSLAGAAKLVDGRGAAKTAAVDYAAENYVNNSGVKASELSITVGVWDGMNATFIPLPETSETIPNAVRVRGTRNNISLFFANIFGTSTTKVDRAATALQGAGKCLGIWGIEGISGVGDLITDSYDIRDGAYGGSNIRPNGDICSCAGIGLNGGVSIRGDAIYGEGYDLDISGTSYEIWGLVEDQHCALAPPEIDWDSPQFTNDNDLIGLTDGGRDPFRGGTNIRINGTENLTLAPGTYYFDSLSLGGGATITISGPTEIYVNGNLSIVGGGIINPTGIPENLVVYTSDNTATVSGTSDFYGGIIAPNADLNVGGTGVFYGVLIGRTLRFNGNGIIHVEENLVRDIFGVDSIAPILVQ